MSKGRISNRSVAALKPGSKDVYLWDEDLSGFGVKVTPAGRKVFLVQYRLGGRKGRTRRVTIGSHGPITPDQARSSAKSVLSEVSAGNDPAAAKQAAKDNPRLGELFETFLVEHVEAKLKPSTCVTYRRLYRDYIPAKLRQRPVTDVTRTDIARLHLSLSDKPYQANRVLALVSKFFGWCEFHSYRPDHSNPCRHIQKFPEEQRERFLSGAELAKLGKALSEADEKQSTSPYVSAAIRLLIFTGARMSEILTLKWQFVDLEHGCLRLPESKTGKKVVYLNGPALDVLDGLERLKGNPYVICGNKEGAHLVNLQKPWRKIRAAAGLNDVRIHDLRHSFASIGASDGQSLSMLGKLLGHSQSRTTMRYAHLAADPVREANAKIGLRIATAMDAESHVQRTKKVE